MKANTPKGQTTVEFLGALVLSALLVAALLGISNQVMPGLFQAMSNGNEAAFTSEAAPGN